MCCSCVLYSITNTYTIIVFLAADNSVYDPSSGSAEHSERALSLQSFSNVAEAGLWVFRVDGAEIESGGVCVCVCVCVCEGRGNDN